MNLNKFLIGGKRGIRTLEAREGFPVFKTGAINHSASFPGSESSGGGRKIQPFLSY